MNNRIHVNGLAFLRTLAIMGIIIYHIYPYDFKGGFLGVSLFFLLSGYLIAIHSEELRAQRRYSVKNFYKNRILRIYPKLIIVVFVTAGAFKFFYPRALVGSRREIMSILLGYNNYWQISQDASYFARISHLSPFTHMWSLSNELQFYLIWPIIFFVFIFFTIARDKRRAAKIILMLALISSAIMPILYRPDVDVTRIYYGMDTRLFSFLTGAWLGFRKYHFADSDYLILKNKNYSIVAFFVLLALTIISYFLFDGEASPTYLGGMFVTNAMFGAMVFICSDPDVPVGKWLENRLFIFLGNISYEMYLFMYPVIQIFNITRWSRLPFSLLIQIVVIVVLSAMLHGVVSMIMKKDFSFKGSWKLKTHKLALVGSAAVFAVTFIIGGCSVAVSSSSSAEEDAMMEQTLKENAKIIAEQSAKEETRKKEEDDKKEESLLDSVSAIGDSVMLGAAPSLMEVIPGCFVDAKESRMTTAALDVIKEMEANGKLGKTVIIGLGTNGEIGKNNAQDIIDYLGEDRTVFWVNVYGETLQWMDDANRVINEIVEENDNVYLIDWAAAGEANGEWFYGDGIHLQLEGQKGYANFLRKNIEDTMALMEEEKMAEDEKLKKEAAVEYVKKKLDLK